MLSEVGVYWDEVEQEYFNIDAYQREIYQGVVEEYVSQNDA